MKWKDLIPSSVAFVDVETTGLSNQDRIVSLGAIWLSTSSICDGILPVSFIHLVFNPGMPCEKGAYRVHGYSDDLLAEQDSFGEYANFISQYLNSADLLVAHNASFDISFVDRELRHSNERCLHKPIYCTMNGCRNQGMLSVSLANVCKEINLKRESKKHGALEDAWLAMMIYLRLHGCPYVRPFSDAGRFIQPFNLRRLPTDTPNQASSNTGRSNATNVTEVERIDAIVEFVKQAKREGRYRDAEVALLQEIEHQETGSRLNGDGVAPWYYEQLAIIYSKQHLYRRELKILQHYDRQIKAPGRTPTRLKHRLEKLLNRRFARSDN